MGATAQIRASIKMVVMALVTMAAGNAAAAFDHGPLDRLLTKHVKRGRVDYAAIKKGDAAAQLDRYVAALAKASPRNMNRQHKLAFYLNAYNALVIKAVVDRWPRIRSVIKVEGFFKRIRYKVAGKTVTLDALENAIIRPTFKDARVHFALVCAARSCPPLPSRAYRAADIDKTLDRMTRQFVNGWAGVRIRNGKPAISKLFEWYAADFRAAAGSVGKFLARYHRSAAKLLAATKEFTYLEYDWSLNGT